MAQHDALGTRIKTYYEQIPKIKLMRRCPVIVRLDMRCGHTYCKNFKRPFDDFLIKAMQETMKYLCENIQNVVLGYTASDEISLLLIDYKKLNSQAFFDYEVQKVCSITASMATMAFNKIFWERIAEINPAFNFLSTEDEDNAEEYTLAESYGFNPRTIEGLNELEKYVNIYTVAVDKGAMFDSRCFNIVESDVSNYFYWRELDAIRNSIQMVGQANFSHKQLHKKSCNDIQNMLFEEKGINWNDLPTHKKRGSCCIKTTELINGVERSRWIIDEEIPIFKENGREYIEKLLEVDADE